MSTYGHQTHNNTAAADSFYRAFEDKHRGSRQLITERLRIYLPFISPLATTYPDLPVLDVGCGRGEWLELLGQSQVPAYGIDLDDGMLAACAERALNVTRVDAMAHLEMLGRHSLLAVTGFHIAEHLPFATLQALFAHAMRVLVPGGLLILETPNPENLLVGAANFYLDPTHQRPLPSQLLIFMAEHQGFANVRLLRLQEEARLAAGGPVSLYDVLANVSPDYAIVAQSPAGAPPTAALASHTGLSLPDLANRYEQQAQHQAVTTRQLADTAQAQAQQAMHQTQQLHSDVQKIDALTMQLNANFLQLCSQNQQLNNDVQKIDTLTMQLNANVQQLSAKLDQITAQSQQLTAQLSAVYASHSWRITRPLRWLAQRLLGRPD